MKVRVQTDEEIKEDARNQVRTMLVKMSFAARWEPLCEELWWVVRGRKNESEHKLTLPTYCYHIFRLFKKTIFKAFSSHSEIFKIAGEVSAGGMETPGSGQKVVVDWERIGSVVDAGMRGLRFIDVELEDDLKREGLLNLPENQVEDLTELFIGEKWLSAKLEEIQALNPDKSIEQIMTEKAAAFQENLKIATEKAGRLAYDFGPEAMKQFNVGLAKGSDGFLDFKGELVGRRKLRLFFTYAFLLTAWPEIQEMISAKPSKTRNDLWNWLMPFYHAKWIEISDLDKLNRLCDPIRLKFKGPGAPCKIE